MSAFTDATLVTDQDLTNWESKMPALAVKMNAFTGKRTLAKNFLAKELIKRGVDLDSLSDPSQLKDAATFKELELIFVDLSEKADSIASDKAKHYAGLFESELELVILTVTSGTSTDTIKPTISSIPLLRA